jgi:colanic acid/amylovoran biosynthesis glycosyltransferase
VPNSIHLTYHFLPRSENWLYVRLSGLRRYPPIVITSDLIDEKEHPLPDVRAYSALPAWKRAGYHLPTGPFRPPSLPNRHSNFAWRAMKGTNARIIHAHYGTLARDRAPLLAKARAQLRCATVVSFYGYDLIGLRPEARDDRIVALFDTEHAFVVEGPFMAQRLISAGCPPDKVHVNALGLDLTQFGDPQDTTIHSEVRLITVGRFTEKKGISDSVRAVAAAKRAGAPVRLTIVGDGELRREIEETIRVERMETYVRLVGAVSHERLIGEYRDHEILIQASRTASDGDSEGGAPVCISEAMAAGLAIVATKHADIPYVVQDGATALLSDERDQQQLVVNILTLANDSGLRSRFGRAGRQRALSNFDAEVQATKLEDIYDQIELK